MTNMQWNKKLKKRCFFITIANPTTTNTAVTKLSASISVVFACALAIKAKNISQSQFAAYKCNRNSQQIRQQSGDNKSLFICLQCIASHCCCFIITVSTANALNARTSNVPRNTTPTMAASSSLLKSFVYFNAVCLRLRLALIGV